MLRGEEVTAVIPVRGGSKGIPRKNLYRIGGETLLERTIKLALGCPAIDRVVVSTDDSEMYAIARQFGVAAPSLRPAHLATDDARTVDVVLHASASVGVDSGWILLLQVTSPLRTSHDLDSFLDVFSSAPPRAKSAVSLVRFDSPHPDKIQRIDDGFVRSYLGKESMVARQILPEVYALNGAFYLSHLRQLLRQKSFLGSNTIPFVMPKEKSVNLDTEADLVLLEAMFQRGLVSIEEIEKE